MSPRARLVALFAFAWHASASLAAPTASDAWIALAPPGAPHAGYLVLHNPGPAPAALIAATSPEFGAIELHRTTQAGDGMRMERLVELALPPGVATALAPGGAHLMLFRPRAALAAGQQVPLTLRFADGSALTVSAVVRDPRKG